MNRKELLRAAWDAPTSETGRFLSNDFQAAYADGSPPLDKSTWLGVGELMESAMPDISWEFEYVGEDGDDALVNTPVSGTFKNDLDLSALGLGVIPATREKDRDGTDSQPVEL